MRRTEGASKLWLMGGHGAPEKERVIKQSASWRRRHTYSSWLLSLIVSACLILSCQGRAEAPQRRPGRLSLYGNVTGSDPGIILHRWGREAWGFLEWPEREIYCLLDARSLTPNSYEGRIVAGAASGSGIEIKIGERDEAIEIQFSEGVLPGMSLRLSRVAPGALPGLVGYRAEREDRYSAVLLADPAGRRGGFWDERLRRGMPPREYASELFSQAESRESGGAGGIEERQTLVYFGDGLVSMLSARSRILGSARETSTRSLSADLVGADAFGTPGRLIEARDVFKEGWEEEAAPLLHEEALRLAVGQKAAANAGASLKGRGFFDEEPRPSSSFFLCRSGAGFHYDIYELGPASLGQIILVIPWAKLAPILKDGIPVSRP